MAETKQPVLIVAGPTASGKTGLALAVAPEFNGVVINADSMQVYRELSVLTARPSPRDEARAPHRLYGVLPATERCSAGRWREMALAEIDEAHKSGRLPIICGGTGLYIKALMDGLSPMPEVPSEIRENVMARMDREGAAALYGELTQRDPAMAARLEPGDSQRIVRALEVLEATGQSLLEWQAVPAEGPPANLAFATILLTPPREALYAACDHRLETMLEAGALGEVQQLSALQLDPSLPVMKALGIAEISALLGGVLEPTEALAQAQQATRRYAKRQMTWFRNQIIADFCINEQFSESLLPEIFAFIRQNLLTRRG